MKTEAVFYGQLADVTGCSSAECSGTNVQEIVNDACSRFPGLEKSRFVTAVGNKIVNGNFTLAENQKVSFLPPFSGG